MYTDEVWTYTGRRELANHKIGYSYVMPDGHAAVYGKRLTGPIVGGNYGVKVKREGDSVVVQKAYQFLGRHDDSELVRDWIALDEAVAAHHAARNYERKEGRQGLYDMSLAQVAAQYAKLPPPLRRAFLAVVLQAITSKTSAYHGGS